MDNTSRFGGWGWNFLDFKASENERRARESAASVADYHEKYGAKHGESVSVDSRFTIEKENGGSIINLSNGATISIGFGEGLKYEGDAQNGGASYSLRYLVTADDGVFKGVDIWLGANYNGDEKFESFNFKQTIRTNKPKDGKTSPYLDSSRKDGFYYSESQVNAFSNKGGFDLIFVDEPRRGRSGFTEWQADLSFIGIRSDGSSKSLFSVTYGFVIFNEKVTDYP